MALSKSIDTKSGAAASYWRIAAAHFDYTGDRLVIEFAGYVSEDARRTGKPPLTYLHFDMRATDSKPLHEVTMADMYAFARSALPGLTFDTVETQARFDGAEDA